MIGRAGCRCRWRSIPRRSVRAAARRRARRGGVRGVPSVTRPG